MGNAAFCVISGSMVDDDLGRDLFFIGVIGRVMMFVREKSCLNFNDDMLRELEVLSCGCRSNSLKCPVNDLFLRHACNKI